MSYFDDASLVMIPSGYKTSKVYSVKPTDGSGDLTFSRSNDTATRVASNGLIERVRTNLALYSQDFSQTGTWVTSTTTRVDSQTDPNGGTTASKFTATGANSNVIQTRTVSSGIPYTWSFYAKSDSATGVNIRLDNGNGNFVQTNMALTTSWQRFSITLNSNATTIQCYLGGGVSFTTGEVVYIAFAQLETGDIATDYIATTSAAVSVGPVANVPRLDYLNSSCPRLLLEPQRQNVITFSEQIDNAAWTKAFSSATANAVTSPSGYQDADKLVEDSSNSEHYLQRSFTTTASTNYSLSGFFKAGERSQVALHLISLSAPFENVIVKVNLTTGTITEQVASNGGTLVGATITALSNGWYRVTVTGNIGTKTNMSLRIYTLNNSGALNYTGDGTSGAYVWGAQLEEGAYATSYIPTLGAAVTRGADAASKTGISSLIGQTEGTIFLDIKPFDVGPNVALRLSDGTNNNRVTFEWSGAKTPVFVVGSSGALQVYAPVTCALGVRHKIAMAYKANDFRIYIDGVLAASDTSGAVPLNLSEIRFGEVPTFDFNGEVNQALLFKTRLTNAQLAELTTL